MKNAILTSMLSAMLLSASILISSTALAQEVTPEKVEAVCMTGLERKVAQVPLARQGSPFEIVVSPNDIDAFISRGFVVTECDSERSSLAQWNQYRDEICAISAFGNDAVQNQLARAFGEYPAVMCASVEKIAGEWSGNSARFFTPTNHRKEVLPAGLDATELDRSAE